MDVQVGVRITVPVVSWDPVVFDMIQQDHHARRLVRTVLRVVMHLDLWQSRHEQDNRQADERKTGGPNRTRAGPWLRLVDQAHRDTVPECQMAFNP